MRKVYSLSILAGLLLVVWGCHGNSAANSTGAANAKPAASGTSEREEAEPDGPARSAAAAPAQGDEYGKDSRLVLVCFGDSLTAGRGTGPGESYPDYLQADLDHLHYHYRVVNQGISGNTTKDGVERLPEILALHPAVAVVEFGGNDGITLPPDYGPDYIKQFDDTYAVLAKKYRVPMLPFLLKDVYGVPGMMQRDETHATAKGNVIVARNVVPLVLPLLKK